jgi:hypothetical protein
VGAPAQPGGGEAQDRVVTVNGDVVTGFVESVDAAVRVESGGKPIDVPLEQVSLVAFQNAPRRPDPLARFWLADGTIASVARFGQTDQNGKVTFEVAAPEPPAPPFEEEGGGSTPGKPQPSGRRSGPLPRTGHRSPLVRDGAGERRLALGAAGSWRCSHSRR